MTYCFYLEIFIMKSDDNYISYIHSNHLRSQDQKQHCKIRNEVLSHIRIPYRRCSNHLKTQKEARNHLLCCRTWTIHKMLGRYSYKTFDRLERFQRLRFSIRINIRIICNEIKVLWLVIHPRCGKFLTLTLMIPRRHFFLLLGHSNNEFRNIY